MEVKIGVLFSAKELTIDVEKTSEEMKATLDEAISRGSGILWLTDAQGRALGVPVDKIVYTEIGTEDRGKLVGF
jgi:hypothetical protein